jgi:hypothetical protein
MVAATTTGARAGTGTLKPKERGGMFELADTAAVASELEQAVHQLRSISRRVAEAAIAAPHRDASGWDGLTAWAYQHCLDQLSRDLEVAQELLRSATDLTAVGIFELGGHA